MSRVVCCGANSRHQAGSGSGSISSLTATDSEASAAAPAVVSDLDLTVVARAVEQKASLDGTWALFLALGLLMIGNGLNGAVVGIRSDSEGFSIVVVGVIMAGYFAGFLLAPSVVVPRIPKVGHIRVFAGLASMASSAVLIHSVWVAPVTWTLMRFVFGFCMAGLYIVIESWLGEMTDTNNRGRTMAIYMIVSMGGLGIGQYLVAVADPNGFELFVVSSVLVSMSLVPVTLAATMKAPVVSLPDPMPIRELINRVPTGVVGSFMAGASVGILFALGAVYATSVEMSLDRTAFFLVAPTVGAIVMQWPIGRLSDKVGRQRVIFAVAIGAGSLTLVMAVLPAGSLVVAILMVLLGGLMFPLYSLVVSLTLDSTPDGKLVGASGTLVRINGAGALSGPLVAAPLISLLGAQWFFWTMSIAFGVVVAYVAFRITVREALPPERQREFVNFPARAGAMAIGIVVKPVRTATRIATGKHSASKRYLAGDVARHPASIELDQEALLSEIYDAPVTPSPIDGD